MNNDAVLRLREPGAFVLLGSGVLYLLGGLIELLFNSDVPFTFRAFNLVNGDQFFAGVAVVAIVVVAVLLATRWGGGPTPQARTIALIGTIVLAAIGIVDALSTLAGLGAGGGQGIVLDVSIASKAAMFLYGIGKLAVLGVGGYYVYTIFQSFTPATNPSTGPYPQQGYQQPPQQPYGGGYGQQQPYGNPPYGQQGRPQYQPPQGPYQQQPPPAQPYQQAQPSDGDWTVAYGAGEQEPPKQGDNQAPGDPYRPPQ